MQTKPRRTTVDVKLTLAPQIAERLRDMAQRSGYSVSEYVSAMIAPRVGVTDSQVEAVRRLLGESAKNKLIVEIATALGRGEPPFPRPGAGNFALSQISLRIAEAARSMRKLCEIDGGATRAQVLARLAELDKTSPDFAAAYREIEAAFDSIMDEREKLRPEWEEASDRETAANDGGTRSSSRGEAGGWASGA
jgi:hypothetical protein